jgi:anti-anti-sigma factor
MRLKGSVDANTQGTLEAKAKEAIDAGSQRLILDMSGVDYLGSAGMRAIHAISRMLSPDEQGMRSPYIKVVSPSPAAAKVFKTLGFDSFIDIHDSIDDALAAF